MLELGLGRSVVKRKQDQSRAKGERERIQLTSFQIETVLSQSDPLENPEFWRIEFVIFSPEKNPGSKSGGNVKKKEEKRIFVREEVQPPTFFFFVW